MNIRPGTQAEVQELWAELDAEVPDPPGFEGRPYAESNVVYVAEDDDGILGALEGHADGAKRWHVDAVHVRPRGRRQGIATGLLRAFTTEARAHGAEWVSLEVLTSNEVGQRVWRALGFEPVEHVLSQPIDTLERRLANAPEGPSRASTHVQSDDRTSVERALTHFVPRLESPDVHDAENGWIRIADPVMDADRVAQARLARESSERLGAVVVALALERGAVVRFQLYERGRMVDEYLSVPVFYGALSKGDELALAANPTLVARLTGADPGEVRRVARTAAAPAELPPAEELYGQIARLMGLDP